MPVLNLINITIKYPHIFQFAKTNKQKKTTVLLMILPKIL